MQKQAGAGQEHIRRGPVPKDRQLLALERIGAATVMASWADRIVRQGQQQHAAPMRMHGIHAPY
ncbi:hypothetical protein AcidC75_13090 [Acidisoma sp. C75]